MEIGSGPEEEVTMRVVAIVTVYEIEGENI